jgi:carbonic anhydrase
MRSLALACAVKGGKEIAIIGHTDCQVCKTSTTQLIDKLETLGVKRHMLPENLIEFFGMFGSERQNVIKDCDLARSSPLIGAKIPVHGLLVDIATGKLDWVVNGYEAKPAPLAAALPGAGALPKLGQELESLGAFADFKLGEMKFPEMKIGEAATKLQSVIAAEAGQLQITAQQAMQAAAPALESAAQTAGKVAEFSQKNWPQPPLLPKSPLPPIKKKAPLPPPIRPRADLRRG